MARPSIYKHHNVCSECKGYMPPVKHKRPYAKMCHDCRGDHRSDNQELKKIYKEIKTTTTETEDWGSQDIITKDDAMHRHHRF